MTRLRELSVGRLAVWRDRVPALHGTVVLVTLWHQRPDKAWDRVFGGLNRRQAIRAIRAMKRAA